jgi:hypothetical protein
LKIVKIVPFLGRRCSGHNRGVTTDPLDPVAVLGLLAEPARLRVVAAVVLGAATVREAAAATGLGLPRAQRAVDRLLAAGVLQVDGAGLRVATERLAATAREQALAKARSRADSAPGDATAEQAEVLRHFVVDGRLASIPSARAKRLVVLDYLAGRFEPGRVYPERDVNFLLGMVFADYAALRRYLVDEGFMERRDGFYWRAGGTFETA